MSYCLIGVEAQVLYTLNGIQKKYITRQTPIDVVVVQLPLFPPPGGGQNPNALYGVVYNLTPESARRQQGFGYSEAGIGNVSGRITKAVIEYGYIGVNINRTPIYTQNFIVENDKGFKYSANLSPNGEFYGAYVVNRIVRQDGVPEDDPNKPKCEIKVSYNGQLIHSDRGNCPIPFEVICGEQCPEGYLKCASTNYPGYCCLPCAPIAAEIKAITSQVRSINNG